VRYRHACQAIEVGDTFVATISHDLKNPLATVGAQAQLLQRVWTSPQGEDTTKKLMTGAHRTKSTVERMSRMIDGLLDVRGSSAAVAGRRGGKSSASRVPLCACPSVELQRP